MTTLIALVGFSFVTSVTPGPNNVLLWASGIRFGFRRTLPHVLGSSVGIGVMALAVAAGIGLLITAVPGLELALKAGGTLYLLYLAYQVAGSHGMRQADVARPMTIAQAAAFQYINPKAWFFALSAVSAFRPPELEVVTGSVAVAATMMVVILPAASVWAAGGHALGQLVASQRASRTVSLVLALLLVATVAWIWI